MDLNTIASSESIERTSSSLKENNFEPIVVDTKEEALAKIQELIPAGATLMNGASVTLTEIGFIDILKEKNHGWRNLHDGILEETDQAQQSQLRKESVLSDFYVGSVHALTEKGEMIIASNTGSQLPHLAFTSPNLVLIVGANKIVPTLEAGFERIKQHVVPLEDERMQKARGIGTLWAKSLILHKENPMMGRKVNVIIVKDTLGF